MSIYSIFETDQDSERSGFQLCIQDGDKEISFWLARAGGANKRFANRMQALMRPHQHAANAGTLADETAAKILSQVIAETVITDWEGVVDRQGETVPYSVEAAKTLLVDLPDLRDLIFKESQRSANFLAIEREVDSGN